MPQNTNVADPNKRYDAATGEPIENKYWSSADYQTYVDSLNPSPELRAELMKNPWLHAAPWKGNWWQEAFDPEYYASQYYGNIRTQALQWADNMRESFRQQDYNDAVSQVSRQAVAGLNPDLNGQVTAGSAAENDQPPLPSPYNGVSEHGFETVQQLASFGLNFMSSIFSFGKQIQDLNIGSFARVSSELSAGVSAREFVLNELAGIEPGKLSKALESGNIVEVLNPRIFSGYSRKTRSFIEHFLTRYSDREGLGIQTLIAELRNRKAVANQNTAEIMSSPYFDDNLNKWASNIQENYSNFMAAVQKYTSIANAGRAEVEAKFYGNKPTQQVLGETMSEELYARGDIARSTAASAKYKTEMENAWNSLEKAVKGDGSHWYNTIGLILLNFLRAQVSQPLHMGFNSSSSISDTYGSHSTSHSGSHSSGFHF